MSRYFEMKRISFLVVLVVFIGGFLFFLIWRKPISNESGSTLLPSGTQAVMSPQGQEGNDSTTSDSAVELPPEKQRTMGIRTAVASVSPMKKMLRTVGRVEVDERRLATVNIKVEGWIEKLYADYAGKYVTKGAPLAEVYSPELISLQLEYINLVELVRSVGYRTQRNVEFSWGDRYGTVGRLTTFDPEGLIKVAKQKFALWEIPDDQVREIEETKVPVKTLTLKSPVNGFVFQKPVVKGTRVAPGDKIFDIADLSTVWVLADIYEQEIAYVKAGQKAKITFSSYPGKEFIATVDFVYPSLSGQTRTVKARFVLANSGMFLKPQMFADVEVQLDLGKMLAVPEAAVLDTGTKKVVYVDTGDGFFAARGVETGNRGNGMVEVTRGLKPGEKVAASAVFLIDSEAKLRGVIQ
jgi:membrane fusion protein, copper/silver efflux system